MTDADSPSSHLAESWSSMKKTMLGRVVGMVSLVEGLNKSMQSQLDALGSDTIRIRRFDAGGGNS